MAFYLYFLHIVFSAVQGGGGRGAIDGEQERDFGEGVHIKPWRCSSPAVCLWGIVPPSLGVSPGTVFNLWKTPPPPGRSRVTENPFCRNTPTSRPLRGLLPPLQRGRAVHGDWLGGRAMGGERIFQECQVRPRRDCQIPGHCIGGESPPWGWG